MLKNFESPPSVAINAFLSSPSVLLNANGEVDKNGVRYMAWEAAKAKKNAQHGSLFVAEYDWPTFKSGPKIPALTVTRVLLSQIRSSRRFICLLTSKSRGSQVSVAEVSSSTTFFELEIFQSIVLEKETYLLVHESFDPAQIEQYLDLLKSAFPDWRRCAERRLTDSQVVHAIDNIIHTRPAATQWRVQRPRGHAEDFHSELMNSRDRFIRRELKPKVHFLNLDRQPPTRSECNRDTIESLIREIKNHTADPDVNNDNRLCITWLLLRELSTERLLNEAGEIVQRDPLLLSAWNLALGDWHSVASWGALHSHIYLGTLPTLGTMEVVRVALRPTSDQLGLSTEFPGGGYATSYYSLSKKVPASQRRDILTLARETLLMEVGDDAKYQPGPLAMLGSISLQEGKPLEAVDLYERALAIHTRQENQSQREMGQLLCELSLARLQSGQRFKAADEAACGIALMRDASSSSKKIDGFLIRAMFKSAYVQMLALRPSGAVLYFDALKLAKENGYTDQYTQWGPAGIGKKAWHAIASRIGGH